MPKVMPRTFTQFYSQFCRENKVKSKVHLLNNKHLKIDADRLEKEDWTPIIEALNKYCKDLHSINLYSAHLKRPTKPVIIKSKSDVIAHEPAFLKEPLLKTLIKAVAACINKSDILCSVSLEAFPLNGYTEVLYSSINNQKGLQHLALPYCKLSEEDLICLCRIVTHHTGLQTINLTGCGIKIEGARQIAALIRSQKLVRYAETWKQSLRYRLPEPDIIPGICRLTLNNNTEIGDEGYRVISHELFDDLWIRAIDFQNCGITNLSTDIALNLVEKNPVLRILDLRRNSVPECVLTQIMLSLRKGKTYDDRYDWIDSTVTCNSSTVPSRLEKPWTSSAANLRTCRQNKIMSQMTLNNRDIRKTKSLKEVPNNCDYKTKSKDIVSELERTKNTLHKVSSKLYEERSKRMVLEKEHNEFKTQLEGIRTYLKTYNRSERINRSSDSLKPINKSLQKAALMANIKKKNIKQNLQTETNFINTVVTDKNIINKRCDAKQYPTNSPKCNIKKQLKNARVFLVVPHNKHLKLA